MIWIKSITYLFSSVHIKLVGSTFRRDLIVFSTFFFFDFTVEWSSIDHNLITAKRWAWSTPKPSANSIWIDEHNRFRVVSLDDSFRLKTKKFIYSKPRVTIFASISIINDDVARRNYSISMEDLSSLRKTNSNLNLKYISSL